MMNNEKKRLNTIVNHKTTPSLRGNCKNRIDYKIVLKILGCVESPSPPCIRAYLHVKKNV